MISCCVFVAVAVAVKVYEVSMISSVKKCNGFKEREKIKHNKKNDDQR